MLYASSLFPLLLQTNDTFCAVREMKYNYFFEVMCTKCVEWQKNLPLLSSIAHSFSPSSDIEMNQRLHFQYSNKMESSLGLDFWGLL